MRMPFIGYLSTLPAGVRLPSPSGAGTAYHSAICRTVHTSPTMAPFIETGGKSSRMTAPGLFTKLAARLGSEPW